MAALYIVATPIGNLKDITLRALETLASVSIIAAEDTRVAQKLLAAHGLAAKLISYHQHNAENRDTQIVQELIDGNDVALLTDAGTPLISDPGNSLVQVCRQQDIKVVPIPGVSALITALSVCDLPVHRFCFEGFLPPKQSLRIKKLRSLQHEQRVMIFYEAKHRVVELLQDLIMVFGADRNVMIARELTKLYEQVVSDTADNILHMLNTESIPIQGEFVLIVEGSDGSDVQTLDVDNARALFAALSGSMSHKDAVKLAQTLFSLPKNQLYEIAQQYFQK